MLLTPTQTVLHISTCSASYSENSKYEGESGETRGKVMEESKTLSCASSQETGMTITRGGFRGPSFSSSSQLKKKKNNLDTISVSFSYKTTLIQ